MKWKLLFPVAVLALSGCQTNAEYQTAVDDSLSARLALYNGKSVAEFQSRTGMLASDAYPVSSGRVFVFRTDPVYLTLPATNVTPAVIRSVQCQLLVRAERVTEAATADAWIIQGTERTGGCNNLPI